MIRPSVASETPLSPKAFSFPPISPKAALSPSFSHHRIQSEPVLSPPALSKGWKLLYDLYPHKRIPEVENRAEMPLKAKTEVKQWLKPARLSVLLNKSCKKAGGGNVLGHLQRLFRGDLHVEERSRQEVSDVEQLELQTLKRRTKRAPKSHQRVLSEPTLSSLRPTKAFPAP